MIAAGGVSYNRPLHRLVRSGDVIFMISRYLSPSVNTSSLPIATEFSVVTNANTSQVHTILTIYKNNQLYHDYDNSWCTHLICNSLYLAAGT